ncbi:MAG: DUF3854 domain-containing protein [Terriglobales bacterium]
MTCSSARPVRCCHTPKSKTRPSPIRLDFAVVRDHPSVVVSRLAHMLETYRRRCETIKPGPYFPPSPEMVNDKTVPIVLVEAEKSVLALTAWSERTGQKIIAAGLGGAWGWSTMVGTKEIKGETVEVHGLHPDLTAACRDRKTYVLLDANAATNPDVQKARERLTAELRNIGAEVHVLDLPTLPGINGPDDYLASAGDQAFADLFDDQKVGAAILDDVAAFIKRYMVLTDAQVTAIALWIAHTHAIDACQFTPYLAITSAEKRCGKSRLLEILEYLVREPWMTSGATAPALFRRIDAKRPCLLLDEIDALVKGSPEMAEAVRGVLNAGNKKGATISRCVGNGFRRGHVLARHFAIWPDLWPISPHSAICHDRAIAAWFEVWKRKPAHVTRTDQLAITSGGRIIYSRDVRGFEQVRPDAQTREHL